MRKLCFFLIFALLLQVPTKVQVHAFININSPSAVLMDQGTGNVLFAQNEHERLYPAGLTKMLTAIIVLDYLDPQDIIVVGNEIASVPQGAIRAGHQVGEYITVHNLLRALMIHNGNDSGMILALHAVRAQRNNNAVPIASAEGLFAQLMNERASELGAYNTHFVNPNGLHHDEHVTTAFDLALIARAFIDIPLLREIAARTEFIGNSLYGYLGEVSENVRTIEHHWQDNNELMIGGNYHYIYARGIRSGNTTQSGACLAASAQRNGVELIAIVLNSSDPARWQDTRILFEYGFATYAYHQIVEENQFMDTISVYYAMRGGPTTVDVVSLEGFEALFNQDELTRLERSLNFYETYYELPYKSYYTLHAPVEHGDIVGYVTYSLDGQLLFRSSLISVGEIEARTWDSDMDYYIDLFMDTVFSVSALPFWLGAAGILIGIAGVYFAITERRRNRNTWSIRR